MGRKKKHGFSALHLRRLTFFADHLSTCRLEEYYMEEYENYKSPPVVISGSQVSFVCFPYIYLELPVFEQWEYSHEYGLLLSRGRHWIATEPEEEFIRMFFGLSYKQMLSCFVPYVSNEYRLHSMSEPKEVAKAIYLMLGEIFPFAQRTVLIEKVS